jgi:hypothetical protein
MWCCSSYAIDISGYLKNRDAPCENGSTKPVRQSSHALRQPGDMCFYDRTVAPKFDIEAFSVRIAAWKKGDS